MRWPAATALVPILALALAACGNEPPPSAGVYHSEDATTEGAGDTGEGGDTAADAGGGDAADVGAVEPAEYFRDCGFDLAQPGAELASQTLTSLPIVRRGTQQVIIVPVTYKATISANVTLRNTLSQTVATTAATSTVEPSSAQAAADKHAKRLSGPAATDLMPLAERANLGRRVAAWDAVPCAVPAATRVTATTGEGTTTVTFAPALPSGVLPVFDDARYDAELATPRSFPNITATVVQSADSAVAVGSTHTGTVTVREIDPVYEVAQDGGAGVTVGGDRGFEIVTTFGTPAVTAALGLRPVTRVFIDTVSKTYKAMVIETGEQGAQPIVFIRK